MISNITLLLPDNITIFPSLTYNELNKKLASTSSTKTDALISNLAKNLFQEILYVGCSLGISFACMTFSPIAAETMILYGVTTVITDLFLRLAKIVAKKQIKDQKQEIAWTTLLWKLQGLNNGFFGYLTMGVLAHEEGHAIAGHLLYKNAHPIISRTGLFSALTSSKSKILSNIGILLGANRSRFIVVLGGPLAGVAFATTALMISKWLTKSHPEIADCCRVIGFTAIFHHMSYALSALSRPLMRGHDFVNLWDFGLHPIVAAIGIVAIPIMLRSIHHNQLQDITTLK